MVKSDIWLGVTSKQNAPFLKIFALKNAPMPLMSRIGPGHFKNLARKRFKIFIVWLTILGRHALKDKFPPWGKLQNH